MNETNYNTGKEMVRIKRPFDAEIKKWPKKPLNKRQKDKLTRLFLRQYILTYKKVLRAANLVDDLEDPHSYTNFESSKNLDQIYSEVFKCRKKIEELKEKGHKYDRYVQRLEELTFIIDKHSASSETLSSYSDDIGQEAVVHFGRCLLRFDLKRFEGRISKVNIESSKDKNGKYKGDTKKTIEFYFKDFLNKCLNGLVLDTIKWLDDRNIPVFSHDSDYNSFSYNLDHEANHTMFKSENCEISDIDEVKLDSFRHIFDEISDKELKRFVFSKIYLTTDMVQKQFKDRYSELNEQFFIFKERVLMAAEIETRIYNQ